MQGLYFPLPVPAPEIIRPLLLFFERITGYQPTEADPGAILPLAADLWHPYPPAPLGSDLPRFKRLVRDMMENAVIYRHARLQALEQEEEHGEGDWPTLAAMIRQGASEAIVDPEQERLWEARLLLHLAGRQAEEEHEIHRGLAAVASRESELFRLLHGEEENGFPVELPPWSAPAAPARPRFEAGKLLTAWGRLFLVDSAPDRPQLLVTDYEEAAEAIFAAYQKLKSARPQFLFSLPLPSLAELPESTYLAERQRLRHAGREALVALQTILQQAAATAKPPSDLTAEAETALADWEKTRGGARKPDFLLSFYRLPDISWTEILQHAGGAAPSTAASGAGHSLLALCSPA